MLDVLRGAAKRPDLSKYLTRLSLRSRPQHLVAAFAGIDNRIDEVVDGATER